MRGSAVLRLEFVGLTLVMLATLAGFQGRANAQASADPDPVGAPSDLRARAPKRHPPKNMRELRERPSDGWSVCSEKRPVCVHANRPATRDAVSRALAAAETTFLTFDALKLPHPRLDGARGGDGRFDIYLSSDATDEHVIADVGGTDPASDGTSSFAVVPLSWNGGCDDEQRVGRAISEAALLGVDGSADRGVVSMNARYLASLATPCETAEIEAVDSFQRAPDRNLVSPSSASVLNEEAVTGNLESDIALHHAEPGSFLFPQFLDERFGAQGPGNIVFSLFEVTAHKSPSSSTDWVDDPTFFDALRSTLRPHQQSFGQAMLDFAVDRAFMGTRSDGGHMNDVARFGDLGRVRFEWAPTYTSLPRRLAPARPLDALGSTYIWLDLSNVPTKGEVTFVAEWEIPFLFRWALVKVDKSGAEVGRIDVAPVFGEYRAEKTVRDIGDLAGLLIVGSNDGEWSKSEPFDAGEPRLDPKSYAVTLYP